MLFVAQFIDGLRSVIYDNAMIALFSDFGSKGPYIGQMCASLYRFSPEANVVNLFADAPKFHVTASSHLLAAYCKCFPENTVFLCVVDPGVGTTSRQGCAVYIDQRWFVGPDNGLFDVVAARGTDVEWFDIIWEPNVLSASFHGRDLFAPVAALLSSGKANNVVSQRDADRTYVDNDLCEVAYIDGYGNCVTGIRAASVDRCHEISVCSHQIKYGHTFGAVEVGAPLWYENSSGLLEVAVNQGCAAELLGANIGDAVVIHR